MLECFPQLTQALCVSDTIQDLFSSKDFLSYCQSPTGNQNYTNIFIIMGDLITANSLLRFQTNLNKIFHFETLVSTSQLKLKPEITSRKVATNSYIHKVTSKKLEFQFSITYKYK